MYSFQVFLTWKLFFHYSHPLKSFLLNLMKKIKIERETKETDISLMLKLDGTGQANISTSIGFFDHMLDLFVFHGCFDLNLSCKGDLEIDAHHTVEDVGISLGQAFKRGLSENKGIVRYGNAFVPMSIDESLSDRYVYLVLCKFRY